MPESDYEKEYRVRAMADPGSGMWDLSENDIAALKWAITRIDTAERLELAAATGITFDLVAHIRRQWEFSQRAFGPATRRHGVVAHLRKECDEIERDPEDVREWDDIIILGVDGYCRTLARQNPDWSEERIARQIAANVSEKVGINIGRKWPDWRDAPDGTAIEHVREEPDVPGGVFDRTMAAIQDGGLDRTSVAPRVTDLTDAELDAMVGSSVNPDVSVPSDADLPVETN